MQASKLEPEPRSWTARVIAPLALVAAAAAIVIVISSSGSTEEPAGEQARGETQTTTTACEDPDAQQALEDGYYVVTAEDTAGLSGIAGKTCTTLKRLERLNPKLDPQTLQVQNCVDLVRDGCKALAE